jgi:hypothetical protein
MSQAGMALLMPFQAAIGAYPAPKLCQFLLVSAPRSRHSRKSVAHPVIRLYGALRIIL